MLNNIEPNRKKSSSGRLSPKEKIIAKGLLETGYIPQDIIHILNQGRPSTLNPARIYEVKADKSIIPASKKEIDDFIKIQSSYDPKTMLNPYIDERLIRSREAMISAVDIFNSPTHTFRTEIFCVLSNIAWTYLIHEKLEREKSNSSILPNGNSVTIGYLVERDEFPIKDEAVKENLKKIIEIRNEVEHTFFLGADLCFASLFQANCLNFEYYLTKWFGQSVTLSKNLSLALQFSRLNKEQVTQAEKANLPKNIRSINDSINTSPFAGNNSFQFKVHYTSEISSKSNADIVKLITNVEENDKVTQTVIKKEKYQRLTQKELVEKVKAKGYKNFKEYDHQKFWQSKWNNKKTRDIEAVEFGEILMKNQWLWFEQKWLPVVLKHCKENSSKFR